MSTSNVAIGVAGAFIDGPETRSPDELLKEFTCNLNRDLTKLGDGS